MGRFEHVGRGDAEVRRTGRSRHDLVDDECRITPHIELHRIEANRPQCGARTVEQVAGFHILGLATAPDQDFALARLQVEHRNLGRSFAAGEIADGAQHRRATRQHRRKQMLRDHLLSRIERRQLLGFAAGCRNAEQSLAGVVRREHNRVVRAPTCSAGRADIPAEGNRRPPGDRDLLQLAADPREDTDPTGVELEERCARSGDAIQRKGVQLIRCAYHQLPARSGDVGQVPAIGGDCEVAVSAREGERPVILALGCSSAVLANEVLETRGALQ